MALIAVAMICLHSCSIEPIGDEKTDYNLGRITINGKSYYCTSYGSLSQGMSLSNDMRLNISCEPTAEDDNNWIEFTIRLPFRNVSELSVGDAFTYEDIYTQVYNVSTSSIYGEVLEGSVLIKSIGTNFVTIEIRDMVVEYDDSRYNVTHHINGTATLYNSVINGGTGESVPFSESEG